MPRKLFILALAALALAATPAAAGGKSKAAQETAEFVMRKFGRKAARNGASALARRIERNAIVHGDDVIKAVRKVGPRSLHMIEEAGSHSKQMARLLAVHGEEGAVYVATRPKALRLVLRHGDDAAAALVKSRGVALPAIESIGKPAVRAFKAIGTPRNARRLAMMTSDGGELAMIGRTPEILAVIGKYGDKAMEFIWEHKGALAVTATLAAFLAEPEPFINGVKEITQTVAKPIAEVPAIAAREGSAEVARKTNWTLVFLTLIATLALLAAARWRLFRRGRSIAAKDG